MVIQDLTQDTTPKINCYETTTNFAARAAGTGHSCLDGKRLSCVNNLHSADHEAVGQVAWLTLWGLMQSIDWSNSRKPCSHARFPSEALEIACQMVLMLLENTVWYGFFW
jgi:hypothetical protein